MLTKKIIFITVILGLFSSVLFSGIKSELIKLERERILKKAIAYLKEKPVTITEFFSPLSAGGKHDYFSQSDYWWPDPKKPDGPYIRRDGETNPDNFESHRLALRRFSIHVGALTSAFIITKDKKYSKHVINHLRAWFIYDSTKMNPDMQYSQAVIGRSTGRGVGIIDAIHLIEVAKAVMILEKSKQIPINDLIQIKKWFKDFAYWMNTHKNGIEEREAKNNHGTCWVMQFAVYSILTGDKENIEFCKKRFKEVLLPKQMDSLGSFPLELERTKPYSYSLFNLDAMATICHVLSDKSDNLWTFTLPDGRNMKKGLEFMYPYILDKSVWPFPKDVMYYDEFPNRQPALLFGGIAFNEKKYIQLWKKLNPDPQNEEVIRNLPIRNPLLWVD